MDEVRRQNNHIKMKERWAEAEKYANILELSKFDVFSYYFDICEKYKDYLLDQNKRQLFIKSCLVEIERKIRYKDRKNEALGIKESLNIEKAPVLNQLKNIPTYDEQQPIDYLKLMLWTINKIGSIEKAEKIFNAAKLALEALKD